MIDDKKGADVLDQTASFFELIASSGLLTFDLEVASIRADWGVRYAPLKKNKYCDSESCLHLMGYPG
jgi:hypothetical protein